MKKYAPDLILRWLHSAGFYKNYLPPPGKVKAGDLKRLTPFSTFFGYDRGGPVDRYYIKNFLQQYAGSIKGRVLEIGDNDYTIQFGGDRILKSDILHVDENNPKATFIGDLANAGHLPNDTFDCFILTQTLHLIYDFRNALQTCYRILKPGGTLLLTVPGISHIDYYDWRDHWMWSFTASSLKKLVSESFKSENIKIATYGNVYASTAFLYGMGATELTTEELDFHDPHYQLIITVKADKE